MTRSELIAKLAAKNPTLYHRDIERLVATILDEVSAALGRGNRVELRGFGAFSVRERKARLGRNPRTGILSDMIPTFGDSMHGSAILILLRHSVLQTSGLES